MRRKTAHGLAVRAEIVLRCSTGCSNSQVARELRLTNATVGKWRSRFVAEGVAGLLDEPRSGAPRRISDDQVEAVIVRTLESTPRDATHWSVRSMAAATGMPKQAVHRIWRAFGLQPHRTESFKLSTDPQLIEKVRDIVGLYLNPPDRALVLCADEKSQIQALDRTQPTLPMRPGQAASAGSGNGRKCLGRPQVESGAYPSCTVVSSASSSTRPRGSLRPAAQAADVASPPNASREIVSLRSAIRRNAGWNGAPSASRNASPCHPDGRLAGGLPAPWRVPRSRPAHAPAASVLRSPAASVLRSPERE
jgi:transposase